MDEFPPSRDQLIAALAATWPAAATEKRNGWLIRRGEGGGKRVSAASAILPNAEIALAEKAMRALGQPLLFTLGPDEAWLDDRLAAAGYEVVDPTLLMVAPAAVVKGQVNAPGQCITADMRLSVMEEIWAAGGIGPSRLAVMDRVAGPRAFLLIRDGDSPVATGFVASDGPIAMLHALEVAPGNRRRGLGALATAAAARWAEEQGATTLALAVTRANSGARALYATMGLTEVSHYHYRIKPDEDQG